MKLTKAFRMLLIYGVLVCIILFLRMLYIQTMRSGKPEFNSSGLGELSVINPSVINQSVINQSVINPSVINPSVINPHRFKFTITSSDACSNRSNPDGELFLILLVKCAPTKRLDRDQIRRTWGGVREVLGRRVLTMFLVGQWPRDRVRYKILLEEEESKFYDIIQEDFDDHYHNLTYKNMMGLRWVSLYCHNVSYVVSVDADMMLNIFTLVHRLEDMPRTNFAEGHLRRNVTAKRDSRSKWYIPRKEYPYLTYPPFLNGACYVMSRDVAVLVFRTSQYVPFLRLDDVFVGITMQRARVVPIFSSLYEQYTDNITQALIKGIGIGILHNRDAVNKRMLHVWHDVVGSRIEQTATIIS